ncbi:hypothetical protein GGR53DRAFT_491887 [Hypoxylon sp. FL1150]|nr:hypothetical protein GGR53DRAFT_491887 [Hypoxylon sp. FL1150]
MSTSTLIGFEANLSSPATEKGFPIDHSPISSNGSRNPQPSYGAKLTSSSRCSYPGCTFEPRGIPGNYPAYLRKHKAIHEKKERIRCDYCVRVFSRRDNMKVHVRKAHPGEIGLNGL